MGLEHRSRSLFKWSRPKPNPLNLNEKPFSPWLKVERPRLDEAEQGMAELKSCSRDLPPDPKQIRVGFRHFLARQPEPWKSPGAKARKQQHGLVAKAPKIIEISSLPRGYHRKIPQLQPNHIGKYVCAHLLSTRTSTFYTLHDTQ